MKLYYFDNVIPNFGDELNPWLWPRLMPEVFKDERDDWYFVGIGTLINCRLPADRPIVIFGTGCGYGPVPKTVPVSWHIYGVRGPRSAEVLGLEKEAVIGDGAILLRNLALAEAPKRHPVSFMPHFYSTILGKWPEVCRLAGINYIDPTWPVETVLEEIRASERLITGAMHGAIVADAFRVPWTAVRPFNEENSFKWFDWAESLDLGFEFARLPASTPDEIIHDRIPWLRRQIQRAQRYGYAAAVVPEGKWEPEFARPLVPETLRRLVPGQVERAAEALRSCLAKPVYLSSEAAIRRVTALLTERLDRFRRDHAAERFGG